MYARVTLVKSDPSKLDAAIANFKEKVVPASQKGPGYSGAFLLVNRETGEGAGGTYWENLESLNGAEQIGLEARRQSIESIGTEILDVDRFEIFIADRKGEPVAPSFSRQSQIYADPAKINAAIEFVHTSVRPNMAAQEGYRSLIGAVNRMTGRIVVTTSWESAEARTASQEAGNKQRQEAAQVAGAGSARVDMWEVAFIDIRQPAGSVDLLGVGEPATAP